MQTHRLLFALLLPLAAACGGTSSPPESPAKSANDEMGDDELYKQWSPPEDDSPSPRSDVNSAAGAPAEPADDLDAEPVGVDPTTKAKPLGNSVAETRTTQVIRDVVLKNRQLIRDCYETQLKRTPEMRGTLTVHFKLDSKGNVSFAEINAARSTLRDPSLTSCAMSKIKALKFPPSSRGFESEINYPFDFKP